MKSEDLDFSDKWLNNWSAVAIKVWKTGPKVRLPSSYGDVRLVLSSHSVCGCRYFENRFEFYLADVEAFIKKECDWPDRPEWIFSGYAGNLIGASLQRFESSQNDFQEIFRVMEKETGEVMDRLFSKFTSLESFFAYILIDENGEHIIHSWVDLVCLRMVIAVMLNKDAAILNSVYLHGLNVVKDFELDEKNTLNKPTEVINRVFGKLSLISGR